MTTTSTYTVTRPGTATPVTLTVDEVGTGRPFLLLHGGAGPASVASFASYLVDNRPARVLVPTHPGFNGTTRPDDVTVRALAELYVALLDQLDLVDVTVAGNSIGGRIAAEIALIASPRVASVIIINGVGIAVPDHPVADFFSLSLDELTQLLSYHDPSRFRVDPSNFTDAQKAIMGANRQAIADYAGRDMTDPTEGGTAGRPYPLLLTCAATRLASSSRSASGTRCSSGSP